jgi:hypothetical protein
MFMNDASFDDEVPRKSKKNMSDITDGVESMQLDGKRRGNGLSSHPNALKDDDLDEIDGDRSGASRSNVIQQQRDLQKKKLQERMGGGVVRTSLPRQYSAPRSIDTDDKPS